MGPWHPSFYPAARENTSPRLTRRDLFRGISCSTKPAPSALSPLCIMQWRPAPPRQGPRTLGRSSGFLEGSAQQHLDVSIEASELVGRPPGQRIMDSWVDPQQDLLAITHGSRVESAGIDDWGSRLIAAEYDHQIAHHRRLAFLVQVDDVSLPQPIER